MLRVTALLLGVLAASCAGHQAKGWSDPALGGAGASSARLDRAERPGVIASIDGHDVGHGFGTATLASGRHAIAYAYYTAGFGVHPQGTLELVLQAGHAYEFRVDLCSWCSPRRHAVWVRDTTTDALVWGKEPDWPSWWL